MTTTQAASVSLAPTSWYKPAHPELIDQLGLDGFARMPALGQLAPALVCRGSPGHRSTPGSPVATHSVIDVLVSQQSWCSAPSTWMNRSSVRT